LRGLPMADLIAFKLNDAQLTKLHDRAEQYHVDSDSRFAKRIVIDYLEDGERERMRKEMTQLRHEVIRLREDLATAVAKLLHRAGRDTAQEAKEWADRNLLSH
jgi:hypothetical protein